MELSDNHDICKSTYSNLPKPCSNLHLGPQMSPHFFGENGKKCQHTWQIGTGYTQIQTNLSSSKTHNCWNPDFHIHWNQKRTRRYAMFKPKYKFTYDEIRIIVMALVELKNQLLSEGRYTDAVDELLIRFVDWLVMFFMLLHTLLNTGQGLIM